MYSLDENLLQGGVENLKKKAGKITHLNIANPKVAPYGVAAKEVLENLDLNELFKDKIVLGENISVPVLHVDSKNADIAIVAYSLVSPINHPKGKTSIIDARILVMMIGHKQGETLIASIAIYGELEILNYNLAHQYAFVLFIFSFLVLFSLYFVNKKMSFQ